MRREIASIISVLLIAITAVGGIFFFAANAEPHLCYALYFNGFGVAKVQVIRMMDLMLML
jgi:hypothetical protein